MKRTSLVLALALAACGGSDSKKVDANGGGGDGPGTSIDAPPAPAMIMLSGTVTEPSLSGPNPVASATVAAYRSNNEMTAIVTVQSDTSGNFTINLPTGGEALVGYLKSSKTGYVDTYLYPQAPIAADLSNIPIAMATSGSNGTYELLSTLAQGNQQPGNALIALVVLDSAALATSNPIAGATASSTPAGTVVRYNMNNVPNSTATSTDTDGIAYLFNETPNTLVSVTAAKTGLTFQTHSVKAWPDALTTTYVSP